MRLCVLFYVRMISPENEVLNAILAYRILKLAFWICEEQAFLESEARATCPWDTRGGRVRNAHVPLLLDVETGKIFHRIMLLGNTETRA